VPLLRWTSSDPKIAFVNGSGEVRGIGPGVVEITAESGGKRGTVAVTVTRYAGLYSLATAQGEPLPQGFASFNCASPTVPVCSGREVVTGGTLVLTPAGEATFTERGRTELTMATSRSVSAWTHVWTGTYTALDGAITFPLERDGQRVTYTGTVSDRRIAFPVTRTSGATPSTLVYAFERP
jgi:hypothetical protein